MDNTTNEEKNTQTCTPDEACCCDPAPEQAPVTVEMIEEAFERLRIMVNQCKTPILLHMLIDKGDRVDSKNATCKSAMEISGPRSIEWYAARGYLFASGACFSGNPEAVSQGVKFIFKEAHKKTDTNPIAAMLGITGCECEECED